MNLEGCYSGFHIWSFNCFLDPACWWWPEATPFLAYSAKLGRKWITKQVALKKSIPHKWQCEISPSMLLKWNIIWHKAKAQKEVAFHWSVIHKAVAVNELHGRIMVEMDTIVLDAACNRWSQWSMGSSTALSLNKGGDMLLTSCGNSLPKKVTLVRINPPLRCNASLVNLYAKLWTILSHMVFLEEWSSMKHLLPTEQFGI